MTQKALALQIIHATLYKKLQWSPEGLIHNQLLMQEGANTIWDGKIITVDMKNKTIFVDSKRQRLPKEISTDLISLIKLKTKKLLKNDSRNTTR